MNKVNTQIQKDEQKSSVKEWIISFLISIILVALLRTFIIGFAIVDGPSMLNTIQNGDRILYSKLIKPDKGDIVVVETQDGIKIIKRVIGLEGDEIEIKKGELFINGKKQSETYIKEPMYAYDSNKITVPKGEIYVMGDNRNISADSREFGTFNLENQYKGKVVLEIFNDFQTY